METLDWTGKTVKINKKVHWSSIAIPKSTPYEVKLDLGTHIVVEYLGKTITPLSKDLFHLTGEAPIPPQLETIPIEACSTGEDFINRKMYLRNIMLTNCVEYLCEKLQCTKEDLELWKSGVVGMPRATADRMHRITFEAVSEDEKKALFVKVYSRFSTREISEAIKMSRKTVQSWNVNNVMSDASYFKLKAFVNLGVRVDE